MQVRGTIEERGQPILRDIAVRVGESRPDDHDSQWFGSFDVPDGAQGVNEGGRYRLVLEDGRSGDILVENAEGPHVGFMGVGRLQ